jgi:hypothetical protein
MPIVTAESIGTRDKNYIINGAFDFWQRGNGNYNFNNSLKYSSDRWFCYSTITTNIYSGQTTYCPSVDESGFNSNYSQNVFTSASATLGTNNVVCIGQRIEGYNIAELSDKFVTLSFWVNTNVPGIYSVNFSNDVNRTYTTSFQVNSISTWEKKIVTVPLLSFIDGTWNTAEGMGLAIVIVLASGPSRITTTETWNSTSVYGIDAAQVNFHGGQNPTNEFWLSQVMLNEGKVPLPVFRRAGKDVNEELSMCQRYFEKSYDLEIPPGESVAAVAQRGFSVTVGESGQSALMQCDFKVTKRTTNYSPFVYSDSGSEGDIRNLSDDVDIDATIDYKGENGFTATTTAPSVSAKVYGCAWTADAEFY